MPSDEIDSETELISFPRKETMLKQAKGFFDHFIFYDNFIRWKKDLLALTIGSSIPKLAIVFVKWYCKEDLYLWKKVASLNLV